MCSTTLIIVVVQNVVYSYLDKIRPTSKQSTTNQSKTKLSINKQSTTKLSITKRQVSCFDTRVCFKD